jgi:putative two-component system response regulator
MGTLAVPERVLLNPGVYTAGERRAMQAHTLRGLAALQQAEAALPCKDPGLQVAKEVTLSHHEHWDGQGYPQGLQGANIPPAARIFALADAYDAMCSAKVYKPALSHEQAVAHIAQERGVQFDPDVVDAFMACAPTMLAIRQRYADTEKNMRDKIEFMLDAVAEPPLP